ncbi:uncharacterized protein LOC135163290 isoform X2 [Diachasmimorpha longicaudata]|uniref:uncharacterized protein LOC135163290 isoform X2 n=1 Tax=Diachasmimorpha longicaudata TaxID=58733 RepID=UPI0030B8B8AE
MRWSILLSLLLAIQTEFRVFAKKGEVKVGGVFTFLDDFTTTNITQCRVKHDYAVYNLHPESQQPRIRHLEGNNCSFQLTDIGIQDDGKWELWTYDSGQEYPSGTHNVTEYYLKVVELEEPDQSSAEKISPAEHPTVPSTETISTSTIKLTTAPTTTLSSTGTTKSTFVWQPVTSPTIEVEKIDGHIGTDVTLSLNTYGYARRCTVLHNNILYEIHPKINLTHARFEGTSRCRFQLIGINWEHAGNWTLTGYYPESEIGYTDDISETLVPHSNIYEITAVERVALQPASRVSINSGYVTFYLPKTFEDPTSCRIQNNQDEVIELSGTKANSSDGIELYKTCGVRMRYNKQREGSWTLTQSRGDSQEIVGSFSIEDATDDEFRETQHHLFWKRGASESLHLSPHLHPITYCDIVRPDGVVIPLTDKQCKYELNVTDKHAGIWKGRYGVYHSMKLLEVDYIVEVWDPESVEVSVTTDGNRINMLCRTGVESLRNCIFQSPNGTIFSLQGAMGDGQYEYYGSGFFSTRYDALPKRAECGLVIREPSFNDYGVWKCSMRKKPENAMTKLKDETIHGLIDVPNPKQKALTGDIVSSPAVYVKRGDPFTIRCSTNAPLNFCWLRSPNGTMYSVTKNGSGKNLLSYNGEGLSMGVCGALVENADDMDNGDWRCQMGVIGAAEVKSIVPVTVTESALIPRSESISVHPGKPTVLSCRTLPSSEATIDYCRWVRPNGDGINRDTLSRYVSQYDNTTCTLRVNAVSDDDLGTWMCFARLTTASDQEVFSSINLTTEIAESASVGNTALHVVAIVLLITTLICTAFMIVSLYRKRNRRSPAPAAVYEGDEYSQYNQAKVLPYFNNLKNSEKSFKQ